MHLQRYIGRHILDGIEAAAALRMSVFREWPYLYDGSLDYELAYLRRYVECQDAILVIAERDGQPVGATTGLPLTAAAPEMHVPFLEQGLLLADYFYCAESVVLPSARGLGLGHRFFDEREAHARQLGYDQCCFCAVDRPLDHPSRPANARSNDGFWQRRGYRRQQDLRCRFAWLDLGQAHPDDKTLTFWTRSF